MLFNSSDFLIFFPIVVLIYFAIPDKVKYLWLLAASYYFYMCWNAKYALLLLTSTAVTYVCGLLLEKIKQSSLDEKTASRYKKWALTGSLVINLGILFYFKYINFAMDSLAALLSLAHIQLTIPQFDIVLPVGISFYTFQALSYTIDVYRDDIYAEKNFFRYALFVSFFPQLVAGPIERSKNLLRQLAVPRKFDYDQARDGLLLMLWGFFLKIVLADRIAIFVDVVYGDYPAYPGFYLILATILFAFQIYCDFSGYSTIAMGAAKIMGFSLMENFDAPYLATSVAQFWRRWHISLTSWFKDYLYIPLGGSRKGKARKYLNKLIVFLVSGLWHGADFSFVVWGGINGIYQILGEWLMPLRSKAVSLLHLDRESFFHKLIHVIGTFILVDFSWIFFRASTFPDAIAIIQSMLTVHNPGIFLDGSIFRCGLDIENFVLMFFCIGLLLLVDCCKCRGIVIREKVLQRGYFFRWLFFTAAVCGILLFGKWGPAFDKASFIYFQF